MIKGKKTNGSMSIVGTAIPPEVKLILCFLFILGPNSGMNQGEIFPDQN